MDELGPVLDPKKCLKTYHKTNKTTENTIIDSEATVLQIPILPAAQKCKDLTTKEAVKLLLEGTLQSKVCRYCLKISPQLSHLEQIFEVAGKAAIYKVSIKDIVASFHPFKVAVDPNFPNRICENCLDRAIAAYLFTQQCEQAERALKNCFDDMYDKLNKLDPLEKTKKRGRQKLRPNHNILLAEHEKVMEYAEPIIHIVNTASEVLTEQAEISKLECLKCCEILPNVESLVNHQTTHPKSMWYNCRLCGSSFPRKHNLKKHFTSNHGINQPEKPVEIPRYECHSCTVTFDKYYSYLQHIEKHKFKSVMEHVIEKRMDKLCSLCFGKGQKMVGLNEKVWLHGGNPDLTGERSLYSVLASTLPQMNVLDNLTGTKICENCLNNALTAYIFINHTYFSRNRLGKCINEMIEKLDGVKDVTNNISIEISENIIMDVKDEFDETVEVESDEKVDVLEDEFRIETENDSDAETKGAQIDKNECKPSTQDVKEEKYEKPTVLNGYTNANDICSEFLTFKTKKTKINTAKFLCPVCSKHFVSDYFLKRHVLKHIPSKTNCNICPSEFRSKFDMYEHKKMTHIFNKNMYLACRVCSRTFIDENKLKYHENYHKRPLCQLCDKKFKSQYKFTDHMRRHLMKLGVVMKKYRQSCSFCEKQCSNDNELSLHVNKVHLEIKPYGCDMCERHFYTEYNLKSHKKVHDIYSKERCEFCKKTLKSRKRLVIHIRKHIGDMPFFCQICNKSFYSQHLLKKHMISSHGGSFLCKLCRVVLVSKNELKMHNIKVHNS